MEGYKILTSDYTSVRDAGRVCYLPDPAAPLPGPWIEVPGKGSYVSLNGEGLFCGGVPQNWKCVRLEVEEPTPTKCARGVECFGRVRVLELLDQPPAATQVGNIGVDAWGSLSLPAATQVGNIWVYEGASPTLPAATQVGSIEVHAGGSLTLPVATRTGDIGVHARGSLTLPVAAQTGDVWVHERGSLTLPAATQTGDIWVKAGGSLTLPAATQTGTIWVDEGGSLTRI